MKRQDDKPNPKRKITSNTNRLNAPLKCVVVVQKALVFNVHKILYRFRAPFIFDGNNVKFDQTTQTSVNYLIG